MVSACFIKSYQVAVGFFVIFLKNSYFNKKHLTFAILLLWLNSP